jgi:hypothetical protein
MPYTIHLPRFGRRAAVAVAAVALLSGGGVAYAAVTVCPTQSNPSHAQLEQYMKCRLDAIETKVDALAKPPVTTTVTATVTAAPTTVTVTATPSTSTTATTTTATSSTTTAPAATFPDAITTGYKTTPTQTVGNTTLGTAGEVFEGKQVNGTITVTAPNVTIRNVYINTGGNFRGILNQAQGTLIEDTTITGTAASESAITGAGFTARRLNISGSGDGIKTDRFLTGGTVIEDSYIHDLGGAAQGAHNDGLEITGTLNIRITHNSVLNQNSQTSALMLSEYYGSGDAGVQVNNNLFGGGGYTLYGGFEPATTLRTGIAVTGNQFTTRFFPASGSYGPLAYWDSRNTWSGNVWADGPNAGKPVG